MLVLIPMFASIGPSLLSKDSAQDPIESHRVLGWGYPPDSSSRKNLGLVCYYCLRVFGARFKAKYKSVEILKQTFGTQMEVMQMFNHWRQMAIDLFKQHSSRDVTVRWGDADSTKRFISRQSMVTSLEEPIERVHGTLISCSTHLAHCTLPRRVSRSFAHRGLACLEHPSQSGTLCEHLASSDLLGSSKRFGTGSQSTRPCEVLNIHDISLWSSMQVATFALRIQMTRCGPWPITRRNSAIIRPMALATNTWIGDQLRASSFQPSGFGKSSERR